MACALRFGAKTSSPLRGGTFFARRCVRGIFRRVHAATKNDPASFRRHRRRKPGRGSGPFLDFSRDGGTGDGSPRLGACFYWECLLSGSPRSGIAGGGAAAAAGRRTGDGRRRCAVRQGRETKDGGRGTGADAALRAGDGGRGTGAGCGRAGGWVLAAIGGGCWPWALRGGGLGGGFRGGREIERVEFLVCWGLILERTAVCLLAGGSGGDGGALRQDEDRRRGLGADR